MERKKRIFILGAGNVARDVLSIYEDLGRIEDVSGIIIEKRFMRPEMGSFEGFKLYDESILDSLGSEAIVISAIASPQKEAFLKKAKEKGCEFDTLIHPSAIIGKNVEIGEGSIVYPGVCITRDVKIGKHAIINVGSSISHDCKISDLSIISPGTNIAGHVSIGEGSFLGIGSTVINGKSVGNFSCIGAGAVVVSDIPDGFLAVGVPAKITRNWSLSDWEKIL